MKVAVLCVAPKSVYHSLKDVECYDINRDVRTFEGGMPVVGHPPFAPPRRASMTWDCPMGSWQMRFWRLAVAYRVTAFSASPNGDQ